MTTKKKTTTGTGEAENLKLKRDGQKKGANEPRSVR